MANNLIVYTIAHQPRRLKIPAQNIPKGSSPEEIEKLIFDSNLDKYYFTRIADKCYRPAIKMFEDMLYDGFKLSVGLSVSFIQQIKSYAPDILDSFRKLVSHPNVEIVGVEPYHSFIFLLDIELFIERMRWMQKYITNEFGKTPTVTDTTEMCMSNVIYSALDKLGFAGGLMDGRKWTHEWRDTTYLYHSEKNTKLFSRAHELSDDVGYRFSDKKWERYPLLCEEYADWLKNKWGDLIFLAWDFETFGEHHWADSGIFEFMRHLPQYLKKNNIESLTPSEAIEKYADKAHLLPLPVFPTTWAGSGGMEFFLGNSIQQAIFYLMAHTLNKAKLTKNPKLLDIALWLLQSDNLHLIQWFGKSGSEAEVSAYFTPKEWWGLTNNRIAWELQQVFKNFVVSMDEYL